jgi:hypothetical protein
MNYFDTKRPLRAYIGLLLTDKIYDQNIDFAHPP